MMTLPSSGALSMSAINAEFGRGNNLNAYRGTTWYTDAGGSGTFSSGAISFSEFYGKRATSPSFSFTISSNQANANLRTLAVNAGWDQNSKVIATIASGIVVYSSSTGTPGLVVNGSFPQGVELINNGYIIGMGGAGGLGSRQLQLAGTPGSPGGIALSVSVGCSITNNGTIGGGGGGGGGGNSYNIGASGGGGGGGRTGLTNSAGGVSQGSGSPGGSGTFSSAGAGGAGYNTYGVPGGNGGNWGAAGASGGSFNASAMSGGSAGAAVQGNSSITWVATGTRYGAIT